MLAFPEPCLADQFRRLGRQEDELTVKVVGQHAIRQMVKDEPSVRGVSVVTGMGPYQTNPDGTRSRPVVSARIGREDFLQLADPSNN